MKWISIADLHLSNNDRYGDIDERGINSRVYDKLYVLRQAIDIANKRMVDMFCILGDVFDNNRPPNRIKKLFYETLFELSPNIIIIIIKGNHDIGVFDDAFNSDEYLLEILSGRSIHVVGEEPYKFALSLDSDQPTLRFLFSGWSRNPQKFAVENRELFKDRVVFWHTEISGAVTGKQYKLTSGINPFALSELGFLRMELGHYHKYQEIGDAIYVGSPLPIDFGEEDYEHGVLYTEAYFDEGVWRFHSKLMPMQSRAFITLKFKEGKFIEANSNKEIKPGDVLRIISYGTKTWGRSSACGEFRSQIREKYSECKIYFDDRFEEETAENIEDVRDEDLTVEGVLSSLIEDEDVVKLGLEILKECGN